MYSLPQRQLKKLPFKKRFKFVFKASNIKQEPIDNDPPFIFIGPLRKVKIEPVAPRPKSNKIAEKCLKPKLEPITSIDNLKPGVLFDTHSDTTDSDFYSTDSDSSDWDSDY